jgi:tRNA modification GTPase
LGPNPGDVEDGLVVAMPGPASFTGEDVVELHVHAGELNLRQVLNACLEAGARAAEAGEFSRRAFTNGVLSLDRAEGIAALIGAQTEAGLSQARRLVAGELGDQVRALIDRVHRLRAELEANLDFPEDVGAADTQRWAEEARGCEGELRGWLEGFDRSRRARERSRVVLVGSPNAGKSSLFNALLGQERALVASVPGTTRDYVDAELSLGRQTVVLVDTAGLRERSGDAIEAAGIELARRQLEGADLVLHLVAAKPVELGADDLEIARAAVDAGVERWLLRTQADRLADAEVEMEGRLMSALRSEDVESLRASLKEWCGGDRPAPWVGLARHRDRVREAIELLVEASTALDADQELELIAFSLQTAEARLGEIDGRSTLGPLGAEVMETIFSSFCIGK